MALNGVKYLDLTIEEETIEKQAKELMTILRPKWPQSDIKVMVFTDGISNKLVGCRLEEDKEKSDVILVRAYGKKTELLIDREAELRVMSILHSAKLSQPVYAKFNNGIAYGFVPGDCLDEVTVRDEHIASLVAEEMVKFHALNTSDIISSMRGDNGHLHISTEAALFTKLQSWLDIIPDTFPHPERAERFKQEIPSMETLRSELAVLKEELTPVGSPVVFCHNDLLLKNIVYNKKLDRAFYIDFEYGSYNYQAFDIANHFCEYAGIDEVDYNLYPDKAYQLKWLRVFLEHMSKQNNNADSAVTDIDVERLYVQVNKFALAAHYWWGVWAVLQACFSTIDFDYLEYAGLRLNEYFKRKEEFLALKMPN